MESIKKRLIFYFYTFDGFKENRAVKIHLSCLKHYSSVFDEALFIIFLDDAEDKELIYETEAEILKIGLKDVRFKVHKNNWYCEAQPFFDEIVGKLKSLDGLTFFGHTKGITNYQKPDVSRDSLDAWLIGMYYLNLQFLDEVEFEMIYSLARFYGAFLTENSEHPGVDWFYSGTFYWLNCLMIHNDSLIGEKEMPVSCHQRGFAESFPGLLYKPFEMSSHERAFLYPYDAYFKACEAVEFLAGKDMEGFEKLRKEITEQISE